MPPPVGRRRARRISGRTLGSFASRGRRETCQESADIDHQRTETIHVRSNGIEVPLPVDSILRIQADENYCHVIARDDVDEQPTRHMVRMTLSDAVAMLPEPSFLQTHRSHVVNLRHVVRLNRDGRQCSVALTNDERVPVSRARTGEVRSRIRELLLADRHRLRKESPGSGG